MWDVPFDQATKRKSPVKSIALQTSFTGWLSGHYHAIKDMASVLTLLGYKVILVLDGLPPEKELATDVETIVLPPYGKNADECRKRIHAIEALCAKYNIDAVIFNAYGWWQKFIDFLAFKRCASSQGMMCLLQFHSSFTRMQSSLGSVGLERIAHTLGFYDAVLAESTLDASFWSEYCNRAFFRPLPIPYDIDLLDASTTDSHDILYQARLSSTKNQIDAIRAFKIVAQRIPDARLVLAGTGDEEYIAECKELAISLGLNNRVVFTGYLRGAEKEQILRKSGCALSTSSVEGYPIALAECKAFGLPLVMYDIPDLTIVEGGIENGTICVPQFDIEALGNALADLLCNDEWRATLGIRAREHIKSIYRFDERDFWDRIFKQMPLEKTPVLQPDKHNRALFECFFNIFKQNAHSLESMKLATAHAQEQKALSDEEALVRTLNSASSYIRGITKEHKALVFSKRYAAQIDANKTADIKVIFPRRFNVRPVVLCTLYSTSPDPSIGLISCSAIHTNENGCTVRVFNNSDHPRTPFVNAVAISSEGSGNSPESSKATWRSDLSASPARNAGKTLFSVAGHSVTSYVISFNHTQYMRPDILCTFAKVNKEANLGLLSCCTGKISTNEFELRVYNNGDQAVTGEINWIAFPTDDTSRLALPKTSLPGRNITKAARNFALDCKQLLDNASSGHLMQSGQTAPVTVAPSESVSLSIRINGMNNLANRNPIAIASIYSTSDSPELGLLTCSIISVDKKHLRIRLHNAGPSQRRPAVSWLIHYE